MLLRDQNGSTSVTNCIRGEGLESAERLICVQDNKAVVQIWRRCLAAPKAAAASSSGPAVPIPYSANLD